MSQTHTLAQRVAAHIFQLAESPGMKVSILNMGSPVAAPSNDLPPILPQDMKEFFTELNGVGFDMESEEVRSLLNMTTWVGGEGKEMCTGFKHWGWVKPDEVVAGAPPTDSAPDERWKKGIFYWNADARDPRPEEGSSIVLFEGSADGYFLCVEVTADQRYKFFRWSNRGYLKPLQVQSFTELMEHGMRMDFCDGWFEESE